MKPLFVTAAAGTEKPLKAELRELGLHKIKGDRGGVHVGDHRPDAAARVCLGTRIGVRVMQEVTSFPCSGEDDLYEGVRDVEWERWLTPTRTLAVSAVSKSASLHHTQYVAQRTKDAIVDRQRRRGGTRSSVDTRDPDVAVFVRLDADRAAVFLDASGRSLHQRGWRARAGEAPLKETLAAAIVRLSGWDRETTLIDPMCGSGTLVIEADHLARGVPPQPAERRFGFERWADHDEDAAAQMKALRAEVAAAARGEGPACFGADVDPDVIDVAKQNARKAGARARFRVEDLRHLEGPGGPVHAITNPPYGERLETDERFWRALPGALEDLGATRVSILVPEGVAARFPRNARAHRLFNGRLRCQLVTWET